MKRIDPTERALGQARAARGYAQGARSLNVVVVFFILPLLILTHNSRWGRGGGEEWAHLATCPLPPAERPQPVGRTLSGRSERPDNYLQVLFLPDWRS